MEQRPAAVCWLKFCCFGSSFVPHLSVHSSLRARSSSNRQLRKEYASAKNNIDELKRSYDVHAQHRMYREKLSEVVSP